MLTKFSEKLFLTAVFLLAVSFLSNSLSAQQCPAPTHVQKDSTTLTHVHFSWMHAPGAIQYKVRYVTPTDTFITTTGAPNVAIPLPQSQVFEIISITSDCGMGLGGGTVTQTIGGVVITIVDIFSRTTWCDSSLYEDDYLFFDDQCMFLKMSDLCAAAAKIGPRSNYLTDEEYENALLAELNAHSNTYNWTPWKEGYKCWDDEGTYYQDPLREGLEAASFSVFPNPFSQNCIIKLDHASSGTCILSVFDVQGKRITQEKMNLNGSEKEIKLGSATELVPGMYILQITLNGESRNVRIVKR